MADKPFFYQDPFPLGPDTTEYECISTEHVSVTEFEGNPVLKIAPEGLTLLAAEAIKAINFTLRPAHLAQVAADRLDRREHRQRVGYPMRTGLRDGETEQRILHLRSHERSALAIRKPIDRANIGIGRQGGMGGDEKGIQFSLVGDSTRSLQELAADVVPILARGKHLRDVRVDTGDANSELSVRVNRERAAAFGFSANQVAQFVSLALRGSSLRDFHREDIEIPVNVRFAGAEHFGAADLESFTVRAPDGREVPLLAMVDVSVLPASTTIQRMNRQTMLKIEAGLAKDSTMPEARKEIEDTLKGLEFPPGYGYTFEGGGFGFNMDANQQMFRNIGIALILMFIVMAAVFESLLFPAAIMSGVVFSVFGVFWLFALTGTTFGIMSFIGILVLMGVVVNNGIVMIEHINNLRRRGMNRTEALVEGSRERLRPIMMTMGTAILAMVPIALSDTQIAGEGPAYYPMARAIAGGLAFSTVVSLLFLPTIYAMLDDLRAGSARLIQRAAERRGFGGGRSWKWLPSRR